MGARVHAEGGAVSRQTIFYFVVREPSGLEHWVRDDGQVPPPNTICRTFAVENDSDEGGAP